MKRVTVLLAGLVVLLALSLALALVHPFGDPRAAITRKLNTLLLMKHLQHLQCPTL